MTVMRKGAAAPGADAAQRGNTRERLLDAAAALIAATPGQDVPLRAICDAVGVKLPTLYHFFGSKEGLLDAVIEHGFARYLAVKSGHESTGDPIEDIRAGWDAHVDFGLANPGFYALMYGQVVPGRLPAAQAEPTRILRGLTRAAADQGRLVVDPDQAADHILAANIGVTLHQIVRRRPDRPLADAVREATIAAITGRRNEPGDSTARAARALLAELGRHGERAAVLDQPELQLLRKWLTTLTRQEP